MARKPIQHNIEDKAFLGLIKRYFRRRDFVMVEALLLDYGRILDDRAKDFNKALEGATEGSFNCDYELCQGHPNPHNYCSSTRREARA